MQMKDLDADCVSELAAYRDIKEPEMIEELQQVFNTLSWVERYA